MSVVTYRKKEMEAMGFLNYLSDAAKAVKQGYADASERNKYEASVNDNAGNEAAEEEDYVICITAVGSDRQAVIDVLCDWLECTTKSAKRILSTLPRAIYGSKQEVEDGKNRLLDVGASVRVIHEDEQVVIKILAAGDRPDHVACALANTGRDFKVTLDVLQELPAYIPLIPEAVEPVMAELKVLGAEAVTVSMAEGFVGTCIDTNEYFSAETKQALASVLQAAGMDATGLLELISKQEGLTLTYALDVMISKFYDQDAAVAVPILRSWLIEHGISADSRASSGTGAVQAHFCSACGSPIAPGAKFCSVCGNRLDS
jgi:ribosomal protein L7/L12